MIIWFNCKISNTRLNPQPRYNLCDNNRFDVARYSFASLASLSPLISRFIFNLELDSEFAGREKEMEDWLFKVLPADKVEVSWFRCNNPAQWEEIRKKVNDIDDDLIFPAGNEDHVFLDSNTKIFSEILTLIKQDPNREAVFMTSHWPESIRAACHFDGVKEGNSVRYRIGNNDALRVMKKEFINYYVDLLTNPNMEVFRTEVWNNIVLPENIIYVPTKEQFRHFDGYAHVGIGADFCPPLEIPLGFFDNNVTVKYGFPDRDPTCVNINPTIEHLYAVDPAGTDYKWCLQDIPPFWNANIITNETIDENAMQIARDTNLLLCSRLHFNWPHFGVRFDDKNYPPADWINPHTLTVEFQD